MPRARTSHAGGISTVERWRWSPTRQREHIDTIAQQRSASPVRLHGDKPVTVGRNARRYAYCDRVDPEDIALMRLALALLEQRGTDTRTVSHVAIQSPSVIEVFCGDGTKLIVALRLSSPSELPS